MGKIAVIIFAGLMFTESFVTGIQLSDDMMAKIKEVSMKAGQQTSMFSQRKQSGRFGSSFSGSDVLLPTGLESLAANGPNCLHENDECGATHFPCCAKEMLVCNIPAGSGNSGNCALRPESQIAMLSKMQKMAIP